MCGLALIFRASADEEAGAISRPLEIKTYRGWSESLVLNAGRVKLVVVPAIGGRALFYGFNGFRKGLKVSDLALGKVVPELPLASEKKDGKK